MNSLKKNEKKKWKKPRISKITKKVFLDGCAMADDLACEGGPIQKSA